MTTKILTPTEQQIRRLQKDIEYMSGVELIERGTDEEVGTERHSLPEEVETQEPVVVNEFLLHLGETDWETIESVVQKTVQRQQPETWIKKIDNPNNTLTVQVYCQDKAR